MHKIYFTLTILILASLLAGCASNVIAQPAEVKALADPTLTALPAQSQILTPVNSEALPQDPPADCPVTMPQDPVFVPPAQYSKLSFEGEFWYGTNTLWTALPQNGAWAGLPLTSDGYTQKIFWWSDSLEEMYDFVATGQRLDAKAPPLNVSKVTNAFASDIGSAMLVGVYFPTAGCWQVAGYYRKTELNFVLWVAP
jgi:hypothetical protein